MILRLQLVDKDFLNILNTVKQFPNGKIYSIIIDRSDCDNSK